MRILITGGAGFIALHVIKYIIRATKWHIVLIDNLSTYPYSWRRIEEEGFTAHPRITRLTWDLTVPLSKGLCKQIDNPKYIIHLAHLSCDNSKDFFMCHNNNTSSTMNIIKYMDTSTIRPTMLYLSGPEIYSLLKHITDTSEVIVEDPKEIEEWTPTNPENPSGFLSSLQEEFLKALITQNIPIIMVTCCEVYGEYAPAQNIIHDIIVEKKIPSTLLYGYQVAEELVKLLEDGVPGEKYHISSTPLTLEETINYDVVPSVHLNCNRLHKMGRPTLSGVLHLSEVCQWYEVNNDWKVST